MIHIIANPKAGYGAIESALDKLTNQCTLFGLKYMVYPTDHPGHAAELAAELPLQPDDRLVIAGGDGSLNEVINGLSLPAPCPVLLLPAGTGNDFARGLSLDRSVSAARKLLADPDALPVPLDLGQAAFTDDRQTTGTRNFAVSCGLGMDAEVCRVLYGSPLKMICNRLGLGKLSYIIHGIQVLLGTSSRRRATLEITLDDRQRMVVPDAAFLSCHNTPFEGGGFPFAPQASPEDGLLSVCVVRVPNRLLLIPVLLAGLMGGKHALFSSLVTLRTCRQIEVHSDRPLCFHSDGEHLEGITDLRVQALPGVLPLLYAPGRD